MPYRTQALLQDWMDQFRADGREIHGHVALQDGSDGRDTGLVIVRLVNATTEMFMQPVAPGEQRWEITLQARPHDSVITPDQLDELSVELQLAADLCRFLQEKSAEHDREAARERRPSGGS
ncbi:hypothetical protein [Microbacterium lushaniae]|uniref:Protein-L-isoaspartate carboxylmethyltransferase n=1 Tax=Microbacterium lushaniae TaxID=2614639 RepID=A0A5J6L1J6_9MICO|nr:hypothetical protein [Microbacterium lushaniae]QEW02252.1 hypothetical protein F6J85_03490 [Microbacterium lushaniae]